MPPPQYTYPFMSSQFLPDDGGNKQPKHVVVVCIVFKALCLS